MPIAQTEYASSTPVYPSTPSAATSSAAPNDYRYGYANPSGTTPPAVSSASDQYTSPSSASTAASIAHLEISTPSQGAIIAISVICGLLLLALLFAILVIIGKRHEREQLHIGIQGGGGGGGHHRRKRHRSEKTYTGYGDVGRLRGFDLGEIGRRRGPPEMDPVFFRAEPAPHLQGNAGLPPDYFPDPRMPNSGRAQTQQEREDIEEVEGLSEVSTT